VYSVQCLWTHERVYKCWWIQGVDLYFAFHELNFLNTKMMTLYTRGRIKANMACWESETLLLSLLPKFFFFFFFCGQHRKAIEIFSSFSAFKIALPITLLYSPPLNICNQTTSKSKSSAIDMFHSTITNIATIFWKINTFDNLVVKKSFSWSNRPEFDLLLLL